MSARNESRKYQKKIELIKRIVGADLERGVLKAAIADIDVDDVPVSSTVNDPVFTDLSYVSGQELSAVDIAARIEALTGALKSNDTDELVARMAGADGVEIVEQALDTDVANTDPALLTFIARALQTSSQDELRSRLHDSTGAQIDPLNQDVLQTVANDELRSRIHDSAGTQIDPATVALEAALKSNDTDEFVSRVAGADGAEVQEVPLDTAAGATDESLLTYVARALASVANDEVRTDIQSAGIQVPFDQQGALEKSAINYGTDIETDVTVTLQVDGYGTVEVYFNNADSATDITIEKSWDNTNWEPVNSETGVASFSDTYSAVTAKHIRLTITGTGTAGETADVVIGAIP